MFVYKNIDKHMYTVYIYMCIYFLYMHLCVYIYASIWNEDFSGGTSVKNQLANAGDTEMWVWPLGQDDPLEEGM